MVRISADEDKIQWDSPFLYLMLLNEEDGLDFRVLQQTDGSRSHLKVFWQGSDVTDAADTFESLISGHLLKDVFKLRAIALLQDRIRQQIERLYESDNPAESIAGTALVGLDRKRNALHLRKSEKLILEKAFAEVDMQVSVTEKPVITDPSTELSPSQKNELLESDVVLRYLGSMDDEEGPEHEETNSELISEDFS
jgi:hypothetical protein